MSIEYIIFKNTAFLDFEKAKRFFKNTSSVLKVSLNNKIDFSIINLFIDNLEHMPNVYGIYTKNSTENKWILRYIGQRKSADIKQRLYQHLIKKHQDTGGQFEKVKQALNNGEDIEIKLIAVFPDELRQYYEAKLLKELGANLWNKNK